MPNMQSRIFEFPSTSFNFPEDAPWISLVKSSIFSACRPGGLPTHGHRTCSAGCGIATSSAWSASSLGLLRAVWSPGIPHGHRWCGESIRPIDVWHNADSRFECYANFAKAGLSDAPGPAGCSHCTHCTLGVIGSHWTRASPSAHGFTCHASI